METKNSLDRIIVEIIKRFWIKGISIYIFVNCILIGVHAQVRNVCMLSVNLWRKDYASSVFRSTNIVNAFFSTRKRYLLLPSKTSALIVINIDQFFCATGHGNVNIFFRFICIIWFEFFRVFFCFFLLDISFDSR